MRGELGEGGVSWLTISNPLLPSYKTCAVHGRHQSPHACDFAGNSTHKQILGQIAEEFECNTNSQLSDRITGDFRREEFGFGLRRPFRMEISRRVGDAGDIGGV